MNLRAKLHVGFLITILAVIIVGFVSMRGMSGLQRDAGENYRMNLSIVKATAEIQLSLKDQVRATEEFIGGFLSRESAEAEIKRTNELIDSSFKVLSEYKAIIGDDHLNEFKDDLNKWELAREEFMSHPESARSGVKSHSDLGLDEHVDVLSHMAEHFGEHVVEDAEHWYQWMSGRNSAYQKYILGAILSVIAFVIGFAFFFARSITRPLHDSICQIDEMSRQFAADTSDVVADGGHEKIEVGDQNELTALADVVSRLKAGVQKKNELARVLDSERSRAMYSSKMATLGEMAGGIAHEINTPLAVVVTRSSQLQELLGDEELDRALLKRFASEIETTGLRIGKIISSLRSFSRDGSRDPLVSCDVKKIVDGTLAFCAQRFNYHGVKLIVDDIPPILQIECRETEISQVLLNLLSNGYDVVEKLDEKWVRISVKDLGDQVGILVTDAGKGIPPEIRTKLFQPFFTTKEIGKGTGLGLGISKRIIENHGGTLSVNAESENTQFVISIPKRQQKEMKASA